MLLSRLFLILVLGLLNIYIYARQHCQWSGFVPYEKNNAPLESVTHKVYLDFSVNKTKPQRVHIGLFGNVVPKVVENFRLLCTGEKGFDEIHNVTLSFKGTKCPRVERYSWMECGDLLNNFNGDGVSALGKPFHPDNFNLGHNGPGYVAMRPGNYRDDRPTNPNYKKVTSIFYITNRVLHHKDDWNVVFGRILYPQEREWFRNLTWYAGNRIGDYTGWKTSPLPWYPTDIEIVDSGELPLDGSETRILNPELYSHIKDDF